MTEREQTTAFHDSPQAESAADRAGVLSIRAAWRQRRPADDVPDRREIARAVVRTRFSKAVQDAALERDRIMSLLDRCGPEDVTESDLELLAADGKGFADFIEARVRL